MGLVAVLVPVCVGLLASMGIAALLPAPGTTPARLGWWAAIIAAAVAGSVAGERVSRRLVPLRALLRASHVFPSPPPPRWRVLARRASTESLLERLREARVDAGAMPDAESVTRILVLVTALQAHDARTRGHAERVRMLCDALTAELELPERDRDRIRWAALLHDVGKIEVPGPVLNQVEPLSEEDWTTIRRHPAAGARIASAVLPWLGEHGRGIAEHHERWDGAGYPAGLAGEAISPAARLIAVVDAYEVMTAPRAYRRAIPAEAARQELAANAGTQFDPAMVRAFLRLSVRRLTAIIGPLTAAAAAAGIRPPPLAPLAVAGATLVTAAAVAAGVGPLAPGTAPAVEVVEATGAPEVAAPPTPAGTASADVADPSPTVAEADVTADPTVTTVPTGPAVPTGTAAGTTPDGGPGGGPPIGAAATGGAGGGGGGGGGGGAPTAPAPQPLPPPSTATPMPTPTATPMPTSMPTPTATPMPTSMPTPTATPMPTSTATPTPTPTPGGGPQPMDDSATVPTGGTAIVDVLANDQPGDAPLDPSTVTVIEQPQHADATVLDDGRIQVDAQPGYAGPDALVYEVCDTGGACASATVALTMQRG